MIALLIVVWKLLVRAWWKLSEGQQQAFIKISLWSGNWLAKTIVVIGGVVGVLSLVWVLFVVITSEAFQKMLWGASQEFSNCSAFLAALFLVMIMAIGSQGKTRRRNCRSTHCYSCKRNLNSGSHSQCGNCGWLTCPNCGACGCHYRY
jgi:hypothetical protein